MSETVYIYGLVEKGTDDIRYVGKTVSPATRLSGHIGSGKSQSSHPKEQWIFDVVRQGGEIEMRIIEECDALSWESREKFWISHYVNQGIMLTNVSKNSRVARSSGVLLPGQEVRLSFRLTGDDHETWKMLREIHRGKTDKYIFDTLLRENASEMLGDQSDDGETKTDRLEETERDLAEVMNRLSSIEKRLEGATLLEIKELLVKLNERLNQYEGD